MKPDSEDRRILIIAPDTFGYYRDIMKACIRIGIAPIWMNQIPGTGVFTRILYRLAPALGYPWANRYFGKELRNYERFDYILIIKGEGVSASAIKNMRVRYPNAKIIYYLWDSLRNVKGAIERIELCDLAYSFDPADCETTANLVHIPDFYSEEGILRAKVPGLAVFIGTLHGNRYEEVQAIGSRIQNETGVKPFLYYYYPNKLLFAVLKLLRRKFRTIPFGNIHFTPLDRKEYQEMLEKAGIVIEICHKDQTGLTMRSLEALGAGAKLITNNRIIRQYDFYRADNCYVIDGILDEGFSRFVKSNYQALNPELVKKYHIDSWLRTLLGG